MILKILFRNYFDNINYTDVQLYFSPHNSHRLIKEATTNIFILYIHCDCIKCINCCNTFLKN